MQQFVALHCGRLSYTQAKIDPPPTFRSSHDFQRTVPSQIRSDQIRLEHTIRSIHRSTSRCFARIKVTVARGKPVSMSLCSTDRCHENLRGITGRAPRILYSVLDGREWLVSRSGRFVRSKKVQGTHWIRSWLGATAGLVMVGEG